jgi:hypothetical protein
MKILSYLLLATVICAMAHTDSYAQARGYFGRAHCMVTGATGTAQAATAPAALKEAIADCIHKGGIPKCCHKGSSVTPL